VRADGEVNDRLQAARGGRRPTPFPVRRDHHVPLPRRRALQVECIPVGRTHPGSRRPGRHNSSRGLIAIAPGRCQLRRGRRLR
jgi:hypothetical protein